MEGKRSNSNSDKDLFYTKWYMAHNKFRKIFGFLLLMFLVEWNPMKTCSIHEFGKRTPTNRTTAHSIARAYRKGGGGVDGGCGSGKGKIDIIIRFSVSHIYLVSESNSAALVDY